MALLKVICWALIFIIRIRFPPGKSLATIFLLHFRECIKKIVFNVIKQINYISFLESQLLHMREKIFEKHNFAWC